MFNFSKREVHVLTFGGLFLIVFIAVGFIYSPSIEKRDNLERILAEKQDSLEEMVLLSQQLLSVSNSSDIQTETIAKRKKEFSLFSFLDSQARQSNVKENVASMKPFTKKLEKSVYTVAIVKVKLKEVYLKALVDFLYHIESSKNGVTITSLSLTKTGKDKVKLDALIETQTLMLTERD